MPPSNRIDGWKAIGSHFGRDRTTAMRWAQTRGLPVRRIPGGKTATVYALKYELDHWARNQDELDEIETVQAVDAPPPAKASFPLNRRTLGLTAGGSVVLAAVVGAGIFGFNRTRGGEQNAPHGLDLPSDPALSNLYLQARDDWAKRTPESLSRAIAALETITREDTRFAPAFSSLADTYLLAREFGGLSDEEAFTKAGAAAQGGLKLDRDLAAAHRAAGFISYWWANEPIVAGRAFRRALELEPSSAQTHFWYGNILSDNGVHAAALRELSLARLLQPGLVAIQTDLAWAQWSAGMQTSGRAAMNHLAQANPDFAVLHDCLAIMALAEGDYGQYLAEFSIYARLKQDASLIAYASKLVDALRQGLPVLQRQLLARAIKRVPTDIGRNHAWPAFVASVAGDRVNLLTVLRTADAANERWGAAGTTSRIGRRWASDAEIIHLLRRRAPQPVE